MRLPRNDPSLDPATNPQAGDQLVIDGETWTVTGRSSSGMTVLTTHPDGRPHPVSLELWQRVAMVAGAHVVRPSVGALHGRTDSSVRNPRCGATQAPGYECVGEPQHEGLHCWQQVAR